MNMNQTGTFKKLIDSCRYDNIKEAQTNCITNNIYNNLFMNKTTNIAELVNYCKYNYELIKFDIQYVMMRQDQAVECIKGTFDQFISQCDSQKSALAYVNCKSDLLNKLKDEKQISDSYHAIWKPKDIEWHAAYMLTGIDNIYTAAISGEWMLNRLQHGYKLAAKLANKSSDNSAYLSKSNMHQTLNICSEFVVGKAITDMSYHLYFLPIKAVTYYTPAILMPMAPALIASYQIYSGYYLAKDFYAAVSNAYTKNNTVDENNKSETTIGYKDLFIKGIVPVAMLYGADYALSYALGSFAKITEICALSVGLVATKPTIANEPPSPILFSSAAAQQPSESLLNLANPQTAEVTLQESTENTMLEENETPATVTATLKI